MPFISDFTTIYCRDGTSESLPGDQARYRAYLHPDEWSLTPPAPLNWQYEKPRYRLTRDLKPAEKARFRFEPPFSETAMDTWHMASGPWQPEMKLKPRRGRMPRCRV
jgi:hypothetical protein